MALLLNALLVLIFIIEGSLVKGDLDNCELHKCHSLFLKEEFEKIKWVPASNEDLERLCPPTIEFVECLTTELEQCTGKDLFELAASENKKIFAIGNLILHAGNLVIDICNKDSDFHKNYLASASCFKELVMDPEPTHKCHREGMAAYNSYSESLELLHEVSEEGVRTRWCMVTAYALACFATELQESCGEAARSMFIEVLKRFQSLKGNECSEDAELAMKTSFLNSLELEGAKKRIFEEVLSLNGRGK